MRDLLKSLDDRLESLVTSIFGPMPEGEERPSLWAKLAFFLVFVILFGMAIASVATLTSLLR